MKYSFQLLVHLLIAAAIGSAAYKHSFSWSLISSFMLGYLLVWLTLLEVASMVVRSHRDAEVLEVQPATLIRRIVLAAGKLRWSECLPQLAFSLTIWVALLSVLWHPPEDPSELLFVRMLPQDLAVFVLLLASVFLAWRWTASPVTEFYFSWGRSGVCLGALVAFVVMLWVASQGSLLWIVYIACKGIEMALLGPVQAPPRPDVLELLPAMVKGSLGLVGLFLWILVAWTLVRAAMTSSKILLGFAWAISFLATAATVGLWLLLYGDFPLLFADLRPVWAHIVRPSTFWILAVGVLGFFQFCLLARDFEEPSSVRQQGVWAMRCIGLACSLPAGLAIAESGYTMFQNGALFSPGSVGFFLGMGNLSQPSMYLDIALLWIGFQLLTGRGGTRRTSRQVPHLVKLQIVAGGFLLGVALPVTWAATLFYIDASLSMIPISVWP